MWRNNDEFGWAAPGGSYRDRRICGSTLTRSLARPPSPVEGEGKKDGCGGASGTEAVGQGVFVGQGAVILLALSPRGRGRTRSGRVRGALGTAFAEKPLSGFRIALMLIALTPLAGCSGDPLAQDPFGDAAAGCGDDPRIWLPGCATRRNIAALADNPADLDRPRREGARDAMRRDALFSGYTRSSSGEPRGATQPAQASGGNREP